MGNPTVVYTARTVPFLAINYTAPNIVRANLINSKTFKVSFLIGQMFHLIWTFLPPVADLVGSKGTGVCACNPFLKNQPCTNLKSISKCLGFCALPPWPWFLFIIVWHPFCDPGSTLAFLHTLTTNVRRWLLFRGKMLFFKDFKLSRGAGYFFCRHTGIASRWYTPLGKRIFWHYFILDQKHKTSLLFLVSAHVVWDPRVGIFSFLVVGYEMMSNCSLNW